MLTVLLAVIDAEKLAFALIDVHVVFAGVFGFAWSTTAAVSVDGPIVEAVATIKIVPSGLRKIRGTYDALFGAP